MTRRQRKGLPWRTLQYSCADWDLRSPVPGTHSTPWPPSMAPNFHFPLTDQCCPSPHAAAEGGWGVS